jgi:hypothetical protein
MQTRMKTGAKLISILLTVALLFSMIPLSALALANDGRQSVSFTFTNPPIKDGLTVGSGWPTSDLYEGDGAKFETVEGKAAFYNAYTESGYSHLYMTMDADFFTQDMNLVMDVEYFDKADLAESTHQVIWRAIGDGAYTSFRLPLNGTNQWVTRSFNINLKHIMTGDTLDNYQIEMYFEKMQIAFHKITIRPEGGEPVTNPQFTAQASNVQATAGQNLNLVINRNADAQALSGTYNVALPSGWTLVSGGTFAAGSAQDTVVVSVPAGFSGSASISVTPTAGGTSYPAVSYTATASSEPVADPQFTAQAASVQVTAGQNASLVINRNADAQALSGTYNVSLPNGWNLVSGGTFAAGSAQDTIVVGVPAGFSGSAAISVTPVVGETSYQAVSFTMVGQSQGDYPINQVTMVSPLPHTTVSGTTNVEFYVPGGTSGTLFIQKQPSDLSVNSMGTREWVGVGGGMFNIDADGHVVVPVNFNDFPKGPIGIRITIWGASVGDIVYYLQLYNQNGVNWKTGLANAPQNPVTQGMNVVYSDDFQTMPSISRTGENATYAATKPDVYGGGTFGWSTFEDPSSQYNPFSQVGDYLKITTTYRPEMTNNPNAGWGQKYTSGNISSMHTDGTGFHTNGNRNQYFECRMFCGANPGMWPSFWTLTANNYASSPSLAPCDELDVIEGYMAWPTSYSATAHAWGDGNPGAGTLTQDQQWVDLYANDTWQYIDLAMGFHTFGLYITENTTYYYLDNVEVFSHATLPLSYQLGNYFLITAAVSDHVDTVTPGGVDFTKYGNTCDTYVDWVRVYESPV